MRKYGGSIRRKIAEIAIEQALDIRWYKDCCEVEKPVWEVTTLSRAGGCED